VPDWWKALPIDDQLQIGEQPNMRTCAGFTELYSKGIMLPLWSELTVQLDGENGYRYQYADAVSALSHHNPVQSGSMIESSETLHLKLDSPWVFSCAEDINWHFSQPVWNQFAGKDYCVPTGVVNYKYMGNTQINILFRKQVRVIQLPHGMPLAHIIPLSERPLTIANHLVDQQEYDRRKILNQPTSFRGGYFKRVKIMQDKESKCPFGFGGKA
jgi:hypothetical protein